MDDNDDSTAGNPFGTDSFLPSVLVSNPAHEAPHEFVVWRGSENNTDELRALLLK